jgi:hypothetical protein
MYYSKKLGYDNMDPLKLYDKIQDLVIQDAKKVAQDTYNNLGTQYGVASVPDHGHDGIGSNQINQKDIIANVGYTALFTLNSTPPLTTLIPAPPNMTRLEIQGFAANNAVVAATKRAIINGFAIFGRNYNLYGSSLNGSIVTANILGAGLPFIQSCNSMYVDSTSLTNNRVNADTLHVIYVKDDTGTVVTSLKVDYYNNGFVSLTQDNWNAAWTASFTLTMR